MVNRAVPGISTKSHKFMVITYHLGRRTEKVLLAGKNHMNGLSRLGNDSVTTSGRNCFDSGRRKG